MIVYDLIATGATFAFVFVVIYATLRELIDILEHRHDE